MLSAPKASTAGLAILLTCLIWLGGFVEGWRNGFLANTPPTGSVTVCATESESTRGKEKSWQFEGWVADREDGPFVPEILVAIDSTVTLGSRLAGSALGKIDWDANTRLLYRQWQLSIPVVELDPGLHTFVVYAVDGSGALAELGRCQWEVVPGARSPSH